MGPRSCRDAPDPAANGSTQGRQVADWRRQQPARKDDGDIRLRQDRRRRRGIREGIRHEGARLVERTLARARSSGWLSRRSQQAGIFRGMRHRFATYAPGRFDTRHRDRRRPGPDEDHCADRQHQPRSADRARCIGERVKGRTPGDGGGRRLRRRAAYRYPPPAAHHG